MSQGAPRSDLVQPFLIDARSIQGRLVRLGPSLDRILAGHDYPGAVGLRLAEALTLAVALAGALKFDGIFTLQIQGDGAIPLLVADVTSGGSLRGYARFNAEKLAAAEAAATPEGAVPRYLGAGFLAFTVDQGPDTERYQGIVDLAGNSLEDCAQRYFEQSEQLETGFMLAAQPPAAGLSGWRAAALMIQRMPLGPASPILTAEESEENWSRARILLASATTRELLDDGPVAQPAVPCRPAGTAALPHPGGTLPLLERPRRNHAALLSAKRNREPQGRAGIGGGDLRILQIVLFFCPERS